MPPRRSLAVPKDRVYAFEGVARDLGGDFGMTRFSSCSSFSLYMPGENEQDGRISSFRIERLAYGLILMSE